MLMTRRFCYSISRKSMCNQSPSSISLPHVPSPQTSDLMSSDLGNVRRRLSVVANGNVNIEGLGPSEETTVGTVTSGLSLVKSYSGVSKKGYAPYNPRKKNQDALVMEEDHSTSSLLLCVFDGHGEFGDLVSEWFSTELPSRLFSHPDWATNVEKALTIVTNELEIELIQNPHVDTRFSGTTAVMCILRDDLVTVANIGDSRATLGERRDGKMTASAVSDDHKPDRPDEKARILSKGGRVFAVRYSDGIDGPQRVWLGDQDIPGLAMSRSLCDVVAHSAGVISTPEFTSRRIPCQDSMLIVASDGLWEFVTDQESVDMVVASGNYEDPFPAVNQLVAEATDRWMREEQVVDDTTVIVLYLKGAAPTSAVTSAVTSSI